MTPREIAHAAFRKSAERGSPLGPMCWTDGWAPAPCIYVCDDVTAAIAADRAASDAREDRLREALKLAVDDLWEARRCLQDVGGTWLPAGGNAVSIHRVTMERARGVAERLLEREPARRALAAIPPRSDR